MTLFKLAALAAWTVLATFVLQTPMENTRPKQQQQHDSIDTSNSCGFACFGQFRVPNTNGERKNYITAIRIY